MISIIIVSYNTIDMTLDCIRSVVEQTDPQSYELIVIDNASADGTVEKISSDFPSVKLIDSKENLGFARANNLAASQANGDRILLLNPDTVILDHAIDKLVAFAADHPDAKMWGGRTVFSDGSLNPTSCWRFMSLWSLFTQAVGLSSLLRKKDFFNREGYGSWKRDNVREVEIVTGCFLLIDRELWDQLEGFDDAFFMYAEEADLCYRARALGARPLLDPDATIVHYGGGSQTAGADKVSRLFTGKSKYLRKHLGPVSSHLAISFLKIACGCPRRRVQLDIAFHRVEVPQAQCNRMEGRLGKTE